MSFHGKKNIYVCRQCCGHIVTVDVDEGVTPFMTTCHVTAGCRIEALSAALQFYAGEHNYRQTGPYHDPDPPQVLTDGGRRARAALVPGSGPS